MVFLFVFTEADDIVLAGVYEKHKLKMMYKAREFFGEDKAEEIVHGSAWRVCGGNLWSGHSGR